MTRGMTQQRYLPGSEVRVYVTTESFATIMAAL